MPFITELSHIRGTIHDNHYSIIHGRFVKRIDPYRLRFHGFAIIWLRICRNLVPERGFRHIFFKYLLEGGCQKRSDVV